jgi:hypothetical protein
MKMVATVEPRIEIDDRIRESPQLMKAVTEATAFLSRQVEHVPLPVAIRWRFLPLDPSSVELTLSDATDFSDMIARRSFRLHELEDAYLRDVETLRTWRELLRLRSDKHLAKIDAYINDLNRVLLEQGEAKP